MNNRHQTILPVSLLLAAIIGLMAQPGFSQTVRTRSISMNTYYQQQTRWCSAAAAQMLIHYMRPNYTSVTQSDIYFESAGYIKNEGGFSVGDFMAPFGVKADLTWGAIPFSSIMTQIDAGKPVEVDIQWKCSGCGTHSVMITGYRQVISGGVEYQYLYVWNPIDGWWYDTSTKYMFEYTKFKDNSSFSWHITRSNVRLQ